MNKAIYDWSKRVGSALLRLLVRTHFQNLQDLPKGPYLLVFNHISHFDAPFAVWAMPQRLEFMTMRELFRPRWFAAWLRAVGCFEVDRGRFDFTAVRTALRRLEAGACVAIFPEGGIRTGRASILEGAAFPTGVAEMARFADCPVRTCLILGTDQLYGWRNWFRRPSIHIVGGNEFFPDRSLPKKAARELLARQLEADFQRMARRVLQNLPEALHPRTAQERMADLDFLRPAFQAPDHGGKDEEVGGKEGVPIA